MRESEEFAYSSRMSKGVSFDDVHFDLITAMFSPNANSPRDAAHQMVRARSLKLCGGILCISDVPDWKDLHLPVGLEEAKKLCLEREDFSMNILDDRGIG